MIKSLRANTIWAALVLTGGLLNGQQLRSTFLGGDINGEIAPVQTLGNNPKAYPEPLAKSCMWESNDTIYLFGGEVFENNDNTDGDILVNNRLWSYNDVNGWSIISGSATNLKFGVSGTTLSTVSYGQKGVAAGANQIGARSGAAHSTAPNGDLYVFGGFGQAANGLGLLGDLWKWDGSNWTWLAGSDNINPSANYGSQGVAAGTNDPGARKGAVMWFDAAGDLFLFGGSSSGHGLTNKTHNSLWKWDGTNWIWIDGNVNTDVPATILNVSFYPQSLDFPAFCKTANGDIYLYGGGRMYQSDSTTYQPQNTLWLFDGQGWSLVSGNHDNPDGEAMVFPLPRVGASLFEFNDVLYLLGGLWNASGASNTYINQPGQFDGQSWSRTDYLESSYQSGNYGVFSPVNNIGHTAFASACQNNNEALIYGGLARNANMGNGFMKFNGQSYADLGYGYPSSNSDQFYQGISPSPIPGGRYEAQYCYNKSNKALYVFGGTSVNGDESDLWVYKNGYWEMIDHGGSVNQAPDYTNPGLHPGSRSEGVMWMDSGDTLWLFGGYGKSTNGSTGLKNDLWYFYGSEWHYYRGSTTIDAAGVYGTQGVAASSNTPGARRAMKVWVDANGDAYMFGGSANAANNFSADNEVFNDLWKFNGVDWVWVGGSQTGGSAGTNGVQGVAAQGNVPSARHNYALTGNDNGFYLFGGISVKSGGGLTGANDLWYYNFAADQWAWLDGGDNSANYPSVQYGPATDNSNTYRPGFLIAAHLLMINDKLFLSGGFGSPGSHLQNSAWHWDGSGWAWLKGTKNPQLPTETTANHGDLMDGSYAYYHSGRADPVIWSDGDFAYVYGGRGVNFNGSSQARLNDIWALSLGNFWDGSSWSQETPRSADSDMQVFGNGAQSSSLTAGDVIIDADFGFDVGATDLNVYGDIHNYGSGIANQGNIYIKGDEPQNIYGNILDLDGVMEVSSASTLETNDLLRIKQTSNTTYGQLVPWGVVNDSIYFERYFDLASGNDNARGFNVVFPVNGYMRNAQIDGYSLSDPSNSGASNWRQWNSANANWEVPDFTNPNHEHTIHDSYWVYAGNSRFGNFITGNGQSGTVQVKGLVPSGDGFFQMTSNDGQSSNSTFVGGTDVAATQGWFLIGNPFTHNCDLYSNLTIGRGNFNSALYLWDGSNYATYINGAATNGGTAVLAPGQAAFIQCKFSAPNLYAINISRSVAYQSGSNASLYKSAQSLDGLKLQVYEDLDTTKKDEIWLGFSPKATMNFDGGLEAWDFWNASGVPNLAVPIAAGNLSIAVFNPDSTQSQALYLNSNAQGQNMRIRVNTTELKSFGHVYLEDRKLDYLQSLMFHSEYRFVYDSAFADNRFVLHFSQGLELPSQSINEELCYSFKQGSGLFLRCINPNIATAFKVRVYNLSGTLVESLQWAPEVDGDLEILNGRNSGLYIVELQQDGNHDSVSQKLKVLK